MVITAVAETLESAADVATNETRGELGTWVGAVYVMVVPDAVVVAESVPHAFLLQFAPERLQLTPLFCVSF
jgi:hypothetical protein